MIEKNNKKNSWKKRWIGIFSAAVLVIAGVVFIYNASSSSSSYLILDGSTSKVKKTSTSSFEIGVSQMSSSHHPYAQNNQATDVLRKLVYQPLLEIKEDQSISYKLAKEIKVSRQGTEIKIQLKEGEQFSDGEALTAQAVKDAYEWHSNPDHESVFAVQTANIKDIQVQDQTQLTMTLYKPMLRLPELFTIPIMHCVKDNSAYGITFAGSGSYIISELVPLSNMTLIPADGGFHPYDEIHIAVMNYSEFAGIVKKQTTAMFMVGKDGYMDELEKSGAYDVYAMQEPEGMYLVFQDSDMLKDAAARQALAACIDTAKITESLKSMELIPAKGITSARKSGITYRNALEKQVLSDREIHILYQPSAYSRGAAQQLQKQLQEKGVKVMIEEYTADTASSGDACLMMTSYEKLLEAKDMSEFYHSLEDGLDIQDYDDRLEVYLGEQAWFIPIYKQTIWMAALHGRDTFTMFD